MVLFSCVFWGCAGIGAGTHGSIKSYTFPVRKEVLQKNVEELISNSSNIHRDSIGYNIVTVDGGKKDTLRDNYYNDADNYVTMFIQYDGGIYEYTFRYYGGKEYWDTASTSGIFIAYAYDEERKGGSAGNGGVHSYDLSLKKRLTKPFEQAFISKIDSMLGLKHTEE